MLENINEILKAVWTRFAILAAEDPELRGRVRQLAEAVLAHTVEPEPAAATIHTAEEQPAPPSPERKARPALKPRHVAEPRTGPLPELTLGRAAGTAAEAPSLEYPQPRGETADLALIEARCRLKTEAARYAAKRRGPPAAGDSSPELDSTFRGLIARAKELPNCFLWMCHPSGPVPPDWNLYNEVACCFETLADGVALLGRIQEEPETPEELIEGALLLLAEAQSALRAALAGIEWTSDSDQHEVFQWLRATAQERQILIKRHMRLDDPADPGGWSGLAERIKLLDGQVRSRRHMLRHRKRLLGKLKHKAALIAAAPDAAADEWRIFAATVEELLQDGLPPSSRELREILEKVSAWLPELSGLSSGFRLALREFGRFAAAAAATAEEEEEAHERPSEQVLEAAKLLAGRALVLIGGDRRPAAAEALKSAFQLNELYWIDTEEHKSVTRFEPFVARPEVAAVLLAIRWSSHAYGDVSEFCETYGKPLVRLPGGYNVNQVAAQIMQQCSARLREAREHEPVA